MEIPGYEFVGESEPGGSYDWSVFAVWQKDGVFYWASDGGCSCVYEWQDFDTSNPAFEGRGTRHEAISAFRASYDFSESASLLNALMDYRAA